MTNRVGSHPVELFPFNLHARQAQYFHFRPGKTLVRDGPSDHDLDIPTFWRQNYSRRVHRPRGALHPGSLIGAQLKNRLLFREAVRKLELPPGW